MSNIVHIGRSDATRPEVLSSLESRVFFGLRKGKTVREIGIEIGLSELTIVHVMRSITLKTNSETILEAIASLSSGEKYL